MPGEQTFRPDKRLTGGAGRALVSPKYLSCRAWYRHGRITVGRLQQQGGSHNNVSNVTYRHAYITSQSHDRCRASREVRAISSLGVLCLASYGT